VKTSFLKPSEIVGKSLKFVDAKISDANFILNLRTDPKKSQYLSEVRKDLDAQIKWLEKYSNCSDQIYFIITDFDYNKFGTIRMYDKRDTSFCWGSWILIDSAPSYFAIESALMIYKFGLYMGFDKAHFDVRKNNMSVVKFHERFGAVKVRDDKDNFYFEITKESIEASLLKYKNFLPDDIIVKIGNII
jgi:RimJ/RimL family protein N-acetyltransferase